MPLALWIGAIFFETRVTVHFAFVVMSFEGPLDYVCSAAMALCSAWNLYVLSASRHSKERLHCSQLALLKRRPLRTREAQAASRIRGHG